MLESTLLPSCQMSALCVEVINYNFFFYIGGLLIFVMLSVLYYYKFYAKFT